MKIPLSTRLLFLVLPLFLISDALGQTVTGVVRDQRIRKPIAGAHIRIVTPVETDDKVDATTDSSGRFQLSVPQGPSRLHVEADGYHSDEIEIVLERSEVREVTILLEREIEAEEMVVTGTRTLKRIEDVPVRVEVVPEEELEEKLMMKPGNSRMLLSETPGMRMQVASGTSNTAVVSILGMPGRYTKLLRDGFPIYSGALTTLALNEIPPLDLRQVEIVKGVGSLLYGSDALGGVVNFISKSPQRGVFGTLLLNGNSHEGADGSLFLNLSTDNPDLGMLTAVAHGSYQHEVDLDHDAFTDLPRFSRFEGAANYVLPIGASALLTFSQNLSRNSTAGGVLSALDATSLDAPYRERSTTDISASRLSLATGSDDAYLTIRASAATVQRDAVYGGHRFDGTSGNLGLSVDYSFVPDRERAHELLIGAAGLKEKFSEGSKAYDYDFRTAGIYAEDQWGVLDWMTILAGARVDFHDYYSPILIPRLALLLKPADDMALRVAYGSGYKTPSIFVEDVELRGYRNFHQEWNRSPELARSFSTDWNYRFSASEEISMTAGIAGSLTEVSNALVVEEHLHSLTDTHPELHLWNATGPLRTAGGEATLVTEYDHFRLHTGYTYVYAEQTDRGRTYENELQPRHSIASVLMYEDHDGGWRIGLEHYVYSGQLVSNWHETEGGLRFLTSRTPWYTRTGFLIEKAFGGLHLFANFENIFDQRQTHHERTYTGDPVTGANFIQRRIWMPLEGRAINGGIRWHFGK